MNYKYKRFDNCLFRVDENGGVELCRDGKWIPYNEDDNFDVKMMGTPMSEDRANQWVESEIKQPQPA